MPETYEREIDVERLASFLTSRQPSSVLLVGPSGCGKTALVRELVRTKADRQLGGRTFWRTSGGRIVAGQTGYGMWQKRCNELIAEMKEQGVILSLGNLFELMQVGQNSCSSESIASYLRPAMIRGDVLAILECTPQQLSAIEAHDPKLLDAFRTCTIQEPDRESGRRILEKVSAEYAASESTFGKDSLDRLDALHRRYSTYSAYPGRAIHFLKDLRSEIREKRKITEADVITSFANETGLPRLLLDDAIPFEAEETVAWFDARVMSQEKATRRIVDALATIKTRLARPGKPLASFLSIGPTGVGKTELAKALADFLYGSRDRIIRFDMSEFSSPWSAHRLVSSGFGEGEGQLTAAVREEPFSVILLDEFEKAAPEVYDLFLQVLGEGRLTDAAGRVADFTNTVIILTSNLGAASFSRGSMGFDGNDGDAAKAAETHFEDAVKAAVRPEFFNRIDKIIPFMPLERASIERIAVRELALAGEREGLNRDELILHIDPELMEEIIDDGYDIRYGARPSKRALERRLLVPIADFLNKSPRTCGTLKLEKNENDKVVVRFTATETEKAIRESEKKKSASISAKSSGMRRRELSILSASAILSELRSEADTESLLLDAFAAYQNDEPHATLVFQTDHGSWARDLMNGYLETMKTLGSSATIAVYLKDPPKDYQRLNDTGEIEVLPKILAGTQQNKLLDGNLKGVGAVAVQFTKGTPFLWLGQEQGMHVYDPIEGGKQRCMVSVFASLLDNIAMDWQSLQRAPNLKREAVRRLYDETKSNCKDNVLGYTLNGHHSSNLQQELLRRSALNLARAAL